MYLYHSIYVIYTNMFLFGNWQGSVCDIFLTRSLQIADAHENIEIQSARFTAKRHIGILRLKVCSISANAWHDAHKTIQSICAPVQ